jgi:pilus assembly protein Flp/PilA
MKLVSRFWRDESGATAIEYGLIAAGISIAIIVAVNKLGTNLNNMFTSVNPGACPAGGPLPHPIGGLFFDHQSAFFTRSNASSFRFGPPVIEPYFGKL